MKIKIIRQAIQFSMLIILAIVTQSCETEIPPEDPTPPGFSFRIQGDGFDHTFNQDTDFDNIRLNLKRNTTYNFSYVGSDAGGVERIQWNIFPSGYIRIDTSIPAPWNYTFANENEHIRWNGDRSNPLTGAALTGSFTALSIRTRIVFRFDVTDFGGETRRSNSISKELTISTGNIAHIGIINL